MWVWNRPSFPRRLIAQLQYLVHAGSMHWETLVKTQRYTFSPWSLKLSSQNEEHGWLSGLTSSMNGMFVKDAAWSKFLIQIGEYITTERSDKVVYHYLISSTTTILAILEAGVTIVPPTQHHDPLATHPTLQAAPTDITALMARLKSSPSNEPSRYSKTMRGRRRVPNLVIWVSLLSMTQRHGSTSIPWPSSLATLLTSTFSAFWCLMDRVQSQTTTPKYKQFGSWILEWLRKWKH